MIENIRIYENIFVELPEIPEIPKLGVTQQEIRLQNNEKFEIFKIG